MERAHNWCAVWTSRDPEHESKSEARNERAKGTKSQKQANGLDPWQKLSTTTLEDHSCVQVLLSRLRHTARAVGPMRAACGAHRILVTNTRSVSLFARGVFGLDRSARVCCRAWSVDGNTTLGTTNPRLSRTPRRTTTHVTRQIVMASNHAAVTDGIGGTHPAGDGTRGVVTDAARTAPGSSEKDEGHATMGHDAIDATKEIKELRIPFDPALAVATMLALELDGWKFPALRKEVLLTLSSDSENAPGFVVECLARLLDKRNETNGDKSTGKNNVSAADPLAHVLLECLPQPTCALREVIARPQFDTTKNAKFERFINRHHRHLAARLLLESMRNQLYGTPRRKQPALEPRALTRVAETYGVDICDLRLEWVGSTCGDTHDGSCDAESLLNGYVQRLFATGAHGPAVAMTLHFSLPQFTGFDILQTLVANNQFDLAMAVASACPTETRVLLANICVNTNEHAGFRAAWHCVREFELTTQFPGVKRTYFESTITRMVQKGQSEAALRYAGDEPKLQLKVITCLVQQGDVGTAHEYATRAGLDIGRVPGLDLSSDAVEKSVAERNETFLRLLDFGFRDDDVKFVDCETGLKSAFAVLTQAEIIGIDTEWACDFGEDAEGEGTETRQKRNGKKRWRGRRPNRRPREDGSDERETDDDDDGDAPGWLNKDPTETRAGGSNLTGTNTSTGTAETDPNPSPPTRNPASVVALLQVATNTGCVFLIDLPALLEKCPELIAPTLGKVLSDDAIVKAGFGVGEDLRRLASIHPPSFARPENGGPLNGIGPVVDLQNVWASGTRAARAEVDVSVRGRGRGRRLAVATRFKNAQTPNGVGDDARQTTGVDESDDDAASDDDDDEVPMPSDRADVSQTTPLTGPWSKPEHYKRRHAVGLSSLCVAVLGKPLDKSTRMSDWAARPLSDRQTHYAALDAAVLVAILKKLKREHGDELARFAGGVTLNGK